MRRADLQYLVAFQMRPANLDQYGNAEGDFTAQFSEPCAITYRRGGEEVTGARLQAQQPVIMTVNRNARTALIAANWRGVENGRVFDIKEDPTLTECRRFLQFMAVQTRLQGGPGGIV